jgi:glutathione S-transferase
MKDEVDPGVDAFKLRGISCIRLLVTTEEHMIDLYFWPTPNGKKITILLEEARAGLPYNIKPINIGRGDQLTPDFLRISPNGRMPAIVDHEPMGGGAPITIFESGAIMEYLAEKSGTASQVRRRAMGLLADGQPGAQDG